MIRTTLIAAALFLLPCMAHAETAQDPAKALKEFHAFSVERARLSVKLRELTNFVRFYEQKRKQATAETKELETEKAEIMVQQRHVDVKCQPTKLRGKLPAAAAAEKCDRARVEFDARVKQYSSRYKGVYGELAELDKAEKERKASEDETTHLLDEANKLLPSLEKMVADSKEKECILACNAKPPQEIEPCLQACLPAVTPPP